MSARGQASVEFLLILSFLLLIASTYTVYFFFQFAQANGLRRQAELTAFARSVAGEVNGVFLAGPGATGTFLLYPQYQGRNYTIYANSTSHSLEVVLDDGRHASAYLAGPVLQLAWSYGEDQALRNVNGTVVVG